MRHSLGGLPREGPGTRDPLVPPRGRRRTQGSTSSSRSPCPEFHRQSPNSLRPIHKVRKQLRQPSLIRILDVGPHQRPWPPPPSSPGSPRAWLRRNDSRSFKASGPFGNAELGLPGGLRSRCSGNSLGGAPQDCCQAHRLPQLYLWGAPLGSTTRPAMEQVREDA